MPFKMRAVFLGDPTAAGFARRAYRSGIGFPDYGIKMPGLRAATKRPPVPHLGSNLARHPGSPKWLIIQVALQHYGQTAFQTIARLAAGMWLCATRL